MRAFMPASRSGAKDAAEMEKLIGQEIRCRIIKLDVADEDVVVDRRAVLEDEERAAKERRYTEIKEGETVQGTVRSLTDFGAFVDIGGVDALLHVADISWSRVNKPADALTAGQQVRGQSSQGGCRQAAHFGGHEATAAAPLGTGEREVQGGRSRQGTVTRVAEFGAFVELDKGVEGLIHVSEMSWSKKMSKPSEMVKPGEQVEVVILGVNQADRRISLGLKQAMGDPWADVKQKFPVGSVVEGPVVSLTKFGAFVQLAEGVEGMIHVGDISAEKRLNHPQDALKLGQVVKAQVLEIDSEKRRLRLGMKQLVPTSLDEYIAEHKEGDVVTGRMTEVSGGRARVELGEGIQAVCRLSNEAPEKEEKSADPKVGPFVAQFHAAIQVERRPGRRPRQPRARSFRPDSQFPHREAGRRGQAHRSGTGEQPAGEARDTRSRWATRAEGCPAGLGVGADGLGDVPIAFRRKSFCSLSQG